MSENKKEVDKENIDKVEDINKNQNKEVSTDKEKLNEGFKNEGFEIDLETGEPKIKKEKPNKWVTYLLLSLLGVLAVLIIIIIVLNVVSNNISSGGSCSDGTCTLGSYRGLLINVL